MKKYLKKFICFVLNMIIDIIHVLPYKKRRKNNYIEYEKNISEKYSPNEYTFKEYKNLPIDESLDLSIIIPVYNSETYIEKCIESILANVTKYKYEIICINDGSTDKSRKILSKYNQIKTINQKNCGASAARNVGLDNAQGRYISFIDSDDYISPNFIEKMLDCAYKNDRDLVKCGYYRDFNSQLIKYKGLQFSSTDGIQDKITVLEGFLWMGIIKRDIMFKIRFPEGFWYEDMITRPLIYCSCRNIECIEDCLYYYRQHDKMTSKLVEHSNYNKCLSQYYLPRYILKYAIDSGINIDETFKLAIFKEFEVASYTRLYGQKKKLKKELFYMNCLFVSKLNLDNCKVLNKLDKYYLHSYKKQNYLMYKLTSKLQKLSIYI